MKSRNEKGCRYLQHFIIPIFKFIPCHSLKLAVSLFDITNYLRIVINKICFYEWKESYLWLFYIIISNTWMEGQNLPGRAQWTSSNDDRTGHMLPCNTQVGSVSTVTLYNSESLLTVGTFSVNQDQMLIPCSKWLTKIQSNSTLRGIRSWCEGSLQTLR